MIYIVRHTDYDNTDLICLIEGPKADISEIKKQWQEKLIGVMPTPPPSHAIGQVLDQQAYSIYQNNLRDWFRQKGRLSDEDFVNHMISLGYKRIEFEDITFSS